MHSIEDIGDRPGGSVKFLLVLTDRFLQVLVGFQLCQYVREVDSHTREVQCHCSADRDDVIADVPSSE